MGGGVHFLCCGTEALLGFKRVTGRSTVIGGVGGGVHFLYCGTEALLGFKHVSLVGRLSMRMFLLCDLGGSGEEVHIFALWF